MPSARLNVHISHAGAKLITPHGAGVSAVSAHPITNRGRSAALRRPLPKPQAKPAPKAMVRARPQRRILVLHGPNLNLLGTREPHIYGRETLADINARLSTAGRARGVWVEAFQSNFEGALIERTHAATAEGCVAIIVNPAGLTHSSVAWRDALAGVAMPFIEVHLSNVHAREPFRHHSYFSDIAVGVVAGLGSRGYDFALEYFAAKAP